MHENFQVVILRGDPAEELTISLENLAPKYKDNPYSEPTALATGTQTDNISYLRVSLFPGAIGIDFANELDWARNWRFWGLLNCLSKFDGEGGGLTY
jgi:hypothetical protein